jgi:glycosyltransferase involved in cell wall biosynthesis
MMRAYAVGLERCSGEYIAFCDCDDFWIDPLKLQKQVEFMDSETACGLCVTRVLTHGVGAFMGCQSAEYINGHLTYDDLLKGTASIHAQGYYLRKSDFEKYIDFDKFIRLKFPVWDYPIVLELIQHTHFFCLDFYSAVYVKHVESVTNTHKRWKRFKYVMGNHRIRGYYILKYGCKPSTFCYLIYRLCRDIYAVIFKTWNK